MIRRGLADHASQFDGALRLVITQAQIAAQAGLSRRTVSAGLVPLEQAGKLKRGNGVLWWGECLMASVAEFEAASDPRSCVSP